MLTTGEYREEGEQCTIEAISLINLTYYQTSAIHLKIPYTVHNSKAIFDHINKLLQLTFIAEIVYHSWHSQTQQRHTMTTLDKWNDLFRVVQG